MQTSDSPRPADLSPAEVADLADRFVAHVGAYIEWDKTHKLTAATAHPTEPGSPAEADFLSRLESTSVRKYDEAAKIRSVGPKLAAALERHDFDSSGVLSIVHCAGASGGGPDYVRPNWEQHKVALQRAAIQLRNAQAGETDLIDRLVSSPMPPRDAEQVNISELLQLSAQLTQLLNDYRRRRRGLEETAQLAGDVLLRALESGLLGDAAHFTLRAGIERARDGKLPHQLSFAPGTMAGGRRSPQPATHAFIYAVRWLAQEGGTEFGDFFPDGGPDYVQQGMPLLIDLFGRIVKETRDQGTRELAPRRPTETDWRDVQRRPLVMCDEGEAYTNLRDDLLRYLADRPDQMAVVIELPDRFQDPDMLTVSDDDGLIEFGKRKHCRVGPVGKSQLRVEKGWDFGRITGPNRIPMAEILAEALTSTDDERIRLHIRLTSKGRIHVARLKAGPPASEIAQKPPTAETNWRDVQRLLLEMCDNGEAYTNLRDLMERTGCRSTSTVSKAIKRSTTLNAWQARYTKGKASPRASSLTEVHLDNTAQTREPDPAEEAETNDVEIVFARLIQEAQPEERAKLNDMPAEQRRQLVALVQNDPDRYDRVLGRKP